MKKIIFSMVCLLFCGSLLAQSKGYIVVNSEKIFKAVPKYTEAIASIDKLSQDYQTKIDQAFAEIEKMYNNYQSQKAYLSESIRAAQEEQILSREKEVTKYQQDVFGPEGEIMKKRVELIKPVQDAVFTVINTYASTNGYDLVIDIATNPSILYYSPLADKTENIITIVKQK